MHQLRSTSWGLTRAMFVSILKKDCPFAFLLRSSHSVAVLPELTCCKQALLCYTADFLVSLAWNHVDSCCKCDFLKFGGNCAKSPCLGMHSDRFSDWLAAYHPLAAGAKHWMLCRLSSHVWLSSDHIFPCRLCHHMCRRFMSQFLSLYSRRSAFHVFYVSLRPIPARILEVWLPHLYHLLMNLCTNWEFLNEVLDFQSMFARNQFSFFLLSVQVRPGESGHLSWSAHGRLKRHLLSMWLLVIISPSACAFISLWSLSFPGCLLRFDWLRCDGSALWSGDK